ncbi:MAG: DNA primase catalytic subunit PriS [Methanocellales archaeon]
MKEQTKQYLRNKFAEYYKNYKNALILPPRFEKREFGFILFDESYPDIVMRRHKAFVSKQEIEIYIKNMVPAHIFHSVAYYKNPDAPSMKEKEWEGADLVFDLDGDQILKQRTSYSKMLEIVKQEASKLIKDFLIPDFGFSEEEITIIFSGGRGYHVHIRAEEVLQLESHERREIVDYLTGRGLNIEGFLQESLIEGEFGGEAKALRIPAYSEVGWRGRINRAIVNYFQELRSKSEDEAISALVELGGNKRDARRVYSALKEPKNIENLMKGNLDFFKCNEKFWRKLTVQLIEQIKIKIATTTDEPVTADIHRLIRAPGSLHGGTGLRVIPVKLNELESFDPLQDAVVFGEEKVKVNARKAMELNLKGETFKIVEGMNLLPEFAAIFLMCRGAGEYESR